MAKVKERKVQSNIQIEGAVIRFRNFSGKDGKYNARGVRNFCVFLDNDLAEKLQEDGWNVRWLEPRDDQEDKKPYLQVTVSYDNIPPKIVMMTNKGKTILDEDSISILDFAEFEEVDVIIRPYNWEVNDKTGVKAYVKTMYVTLKEDDFEKKYYNVPDSAMNSMEHNAD